MASIITSRVCGQDSGPYWVPVLEVRHRAVFLLFQGAPSLTLALKKMNLV
jgi:hypothetical protein